MSTHNSQALMEVQRSLPVQQSRFDEFLLKTHDLVERANSDKEAATGYEVNSEASFQVADTLQADLKSRMKSLAEERLVLTRSIDDFKQVFVDAEKGVTDALNEAAKTYQAKMLAYRFEIQRKSLEAQQRSEQALQKTKQKELERARKLEERAKLLKTESAKQRLYDEADNIKTAAEMMPESVAIASTEPQTVASDLRDNWKGEPKLGRLADALRWLADHPEWSDVIEFKPGPMKRMAKQFHNVPEKAEPFRFWNDQGFASKRR